MHGRMDDKAVMSASLCLDLQIDACINRLMERMIMDGWLVIDPWDYYIDCIYVIGVLSRKNALIVEIALQNDSNYHHQYRQPNPVNDICDG